MSDRPTASEAQKNCHCNARQGIKVVVLEEVNLRSEVGLGDAHQYLFFFLFLFAKL